MFRARLASLTLTAGLLLSAGCSLCNNNSCPGTGTGTGGGFLSRFRNNNNAAACCPEAALCCETSGAVAYDGPVLTAPVDPYMPPPATMPPLASPPMASPPRIVPVPQASPTPYTPSSLLK